jgi:predicted dehydrogenase
VPPLEPFTAVVDAVAAAIHGGSAVVDPWDAVRNMRVIDALKLSAQEGRRVTVDEIPVIQGE